MRGVSYVQQGVVACREFIKLLMIGSNGQLEASLPATDDERRDVEVHLKGRFGPSLSFQVKSARQLVHKGRMDYLVIFMSVKHELFRPGLHRPLPPGARARSVRQARRDAL